MLTYFTKLWQCSQVSTFALNFINCCVMTWEQIWKMKNVLPVFSEKRTNLNDSSGEEPVVMLVLQQSNINRSLPSSSLDYMSQFVAYTNEPHQQVSQTWSTSSFTITCILYDPNMNNRVLQITQPLHESLSSTLFSMPIRVYVPLCLCILWQCEILHKSQPYENS